jgi:hypothetical protein
MNTIETVTSYLPILDEQYRKASCSAILDTPSEFLQATKDAKKFKIAKIVTDGLANYSRSTGFVNGNVDLTWEEREYSIDRGRALQLDAMDNLETFGLAFGRLAGVFQRQHVIPEMDAIRFSKYYANAGNKVKLALTSANILGAIDDLDATMDNNEVPEEGRILFMNSLKYKMLVNADNITKFLNVEDEMSKALNRKIYSYNGHIIMKVPAGRFYTSITLFDGTTAGQEAGGYQKAADGQDIGLLLVSAEAVVQVAKRDISRFWAPTRAEMDANGADGVNPNADSWKFDFRNYHDAWVLDNKANGIAAITDN